MIETGMSSLFNEIIIFNRLLKHIMPHITLLQKQNTMNSANAYHFCMA